MKITGAFLCLAFAGMMRLSGYHRAVNATGSCVLQQQIEVQALVMISFTKVEEQAAYHHGSLSGLVEQIPVPLLPEQIRTLRDEAFLSQLSKVIFQVGFNWSVVDKK